MPVLSFVAFNGIKKALFLLLFLPVFAKAQVGHVIWEDDFNTIDSSVWNIELGDGCDEGLCGWGNQELQSYQNENVSIEEIPGEPGNYALVLEAREQSIGNSSFTSGKVTTQNNLAVKYGMIEFRIKVPDNLLKGLWPAAWLLGTNQVSDGWPYCGEMDIMEMGHNSTFRNEQEFPSANENNLVAANLIFYEDDACSDQNQDCAASISFDKYYNKPYHTAGTMTDRFMIYRMYWDEKQIRLTVDDNGLVQNLYTGPFPIGDASAAFTKPFYLLLNLAVGGNFTDATTASQVTAGFPGKMYIDYVRIKKWNGRGQVFGAEQVMANAGANKKIQDDETLLLDGSGSYGPISSYTWTLDGNVVATSKTHEIDLDSGTHVFTLTVADEDGNKSEDLLKVNVGDSEIGDIIWEDNFNSFNSDYWNIDIGNGCEEDLCGWGNQELQTYQADNVSIEEISEEPGNFALVLEAKKQSVGINEYTSGKVTTENKVAIQYGVVEVRMKAPDVKDGLWPAAWLLGINHREVGWPYCGEIDMMEMGHSVSERQAEGFSGSPNNFVRANLLWYASGACDTDNPTCAASIAFDKYYTTPYTPSSGLNNRYVTYRMYWNESQIRLTVVDGNNEYDLYTNPFPISPKEEAFTKPYYFLLNLAVGGSFTGLYDTDDISAPLPGKLYIDYVRVKEWNGQGNVSFPNGSVIANAGADIVAEDLDQDGVESVTIDGTSSYGPIASYEWSENGIVLAQESIAELALASGVHNLQLKVIDSQGNSSIDYIKIDVRELLWQDNFNSFDSGIWTPEIGDGCDQDLCGWGNQELQYYTEENLSIESIPNEENNSALVIEAKTQEQGGYSYTSGRVKTEGNLSVKYGLVETRIKVPDDLSTGLWPAFWLLGNNLSEVGWPKSGEIDMMEMGYKKQALFDEGFEDSNEDEVVGGNIIFYSDDACSGGNESCAASISNDKYYTKPYQKATTLTNRFLTYRMYWDPNEIRLTVVDNGVEYDFYTGPFPLGGDAEEFHLPFFLIINLAVGGNFTDAAQNSDVTAELPGKMLIDYVRVFRWNGYGEVGIGDGIIANAGPDIIQWDENGDGTEQVYLDGSASAHHKGQITSYSWLIDGQVVGTNPFISVELARGSYSATLTVSDDQGNESTDELLITISSGGLAPIANAGPDQSVEDENDDDLVNITLDGSQSEAVAAPIATYTWTENDVLLAEGVNPTIELSTGVHTITLEVADEDEQTATDDVIITVIDPNNVLPTADAGEDQTINDNDGDDSVDVSFDGANSFDTDGAIESYVWRANGEEIASEVSITQSFSTGVYTIELTVTDDDGGTDSDSFTLTVVDPDNNPPVANAGDDIFVIDENLDAVEDILLDGSLSTDSDGMIATYQWIENDIVIGTEEELEITLPLGEHNITLKTTDDDGVSSTDEMIVIVNQLPVADAGEEILVSDSDDNGNHQVVLDASNSSDSDGTLSAYSWVYDNAEIGTQQSISYVFDVGVHIVTLKVTDNFGSTATDMVTIYVASLDNTPPIANAGEDIEQYANIGSNTLAVTLDGTSSDDADGNIHVYKWRKGENEIGSGSTPTVNLEVGTHELQLEVTDNEGAKDNDNVLVTVLRKVNIALEKPVTVSSSEAQYSPELAVDGDYETRWGSLFQDPQWIVIDLEARYAVNQVVLYWEEASAREYEIQVSDDNNNWTSVYSTSSGNGETDNLTLSGVGRFIRMLATSRNTEYGYSLFEFEVYGEVTSGGDNSAPTSLSASLVSTTSTTATFSLLAEDDSGYVLFSIEQGNNEQLFSGISAVESTITYSGLTPETSYDFNIRVKDNSGNEYPEIKTITLTTPPSENNSCSGESNEASEGSFDIGYSYSFSTSGTDVTIEFQLLDEKDDLVAYLWQESPFLELAMENIGERKFRAVLGSQTVGNNISYACKFAFANGLAATKYFQYSVGDDCLPSDDDDDDGISNDVDQCPNTPAGANVDGLGCVIPSPEDSDGDGISNDDDQCPNTPAGASVDEVGCEVVTTTGELIVYPIPTTGNLEILIKGNDKIVRTFIFSLSGKVVIDKAFVVPTDRIVKTDISALTKGIYILCVEGNSVRTIQKIIKIDSAE